MTPNERPRSPELLDSPWGPEPETAPKEKVVAPAPGDPDEARDLALSSTYRGSILDRYLNDPKGLAQALENQDRALNSLLLSALKRTVAKDWLVNRDRDGEESAYLCGPGAWRVARPFRISFGRYRNGKGERIAEPEIVVEDDGSYTAEIILDAFSALTGQYIEGVVGRRNSGENFTGRKTMGTMVVPLPVTRNDLRSSAYTRAVSKAVAAIAALHHFPLEKLREAGIDTTKCRKGQGFGSSKQRDAARGGGAPSAPDAAAEDAAAGNGGERPISEAQVKRIKGIAIGRVHPDRHTQATRQEWDVVNRLVGRTLSKFRCASVEALTPTVYEDFCSALTTDPLPGKEG